MTILAKSSRVRHQVTISPTNAPRWHLIGIYFSRKRPTGRECYRLVHPQRWLTSIYDLQFPGSPIRPTE